MSATAGDVDTVRRVYDRWAEGDWRAGEELLSDDLEFRFDDPTLGDVTIRGRAAVADYMREFVSAWSHVRHVADEIVAISDDRVFVSARQIGTGKNSGVETSVSAFAVWTFRGGKVVRLEHLRDPAAARAAAGLPD